MRTPPDPTFLLQALDISLPLTGLYDAPDPSPFAPLVAPKPGARACVFAFFEQWAKGVTLQLTPDNHGCGGAGRSLCGVETRDRDDFLHFLAVDEGLKVSTEAMGHWLDWRRPYSARRGNLLIGPLKAAQWRHLRTVTFWADPDQLSALMIGAQYESAPEDAPPVIAPFGSGCGQLVGMFDDLEAPQAVLGATDIAMREWLAPDLLAFTVTKPMFARLCSLDKNSFLGKPFLQRLRKARGDEL